ncbi:MAG TPA: glycosyltransferase [Methylocystis sp.]|nr:glycosyltransferase [Methylocystis sp.]
MLIFDLILATRRPMTTGVERFGMLLFQAMRKLEPDTIAFVSDPSRLSERAGLIAVGDVYRGWLTLPLDLRRRGLRPRAVVCPTAPASPLFLATRDPLARIIHDVFPWTRARAMPLRGRLLYRDVETLMARRYDVLCGTSEIVAEELSGVLGREDIGWCGNAGSVYADRVTPRPLNGLPHEFVLAVGTVEPRKNYARLLELARAGGAGDLPIVLVGRPGWGDVVGEVERFAAQYPQKLVWLRDLSDDGVLLWLYQRAACFLTLSLAEGFNAPLAEAAACGRPTLCSDLPVHRIVAPPWSLFAAPEATAAELRGQLRAAAAVAPTPDAVEAYRRRYSFDAIARRLDGLIDQAFAAAVAPAR